MTGTPTSRGSADAAAPTSGPGLTGDRPLRVLLVCGELQPRLDGVADAVGRLAGALQASGAAVRILHSGPPAPLPGARSVGAAWSVHRLLAASAALRSADVVHVQFAPSMYRFRGAIGLLPLVPRGRAALVVTLHEYGWWRWTRWLPQRAWRMLEAGRLLDRETALLVPRSAHVVVTNPEHERVVAGRFRGRRRTTRIPIGANVGVAHHDRTAAWHRTREELGLSPSATLVVFFGFVHPVKGVRYLADAVGRLAREGRDLHLLVVGGFESMALPDDEARAFERELRAQIAAVGAAGRTHITGFVSAERASQLLASADLAVLPFTAGVTTKSGSLLSALAHGVPTVVTSPPDPQQELAEVCVVVPRVRDAGALADGMRRVLDDPALAARLAAAGPAFTTERNWDAIAERHLQLYRRVIR